MSKFNTFMEGDKVFYNGDRFKHELTREGKPVAGWIHATVKNEEDVYVVEFTEVKNGDYIMPARVLSKAPVQSDKVDGPEIQHRRVKQEEEK